MKKFILICLVCSPHTLLANDQIPVDDSAPKEYAFAYERPGKRTTASVEQMKSTQSKKAVINGKKKVGSKQR